MNHKNSLIPPWKMPDSWQEINKTIAQTIRNNGKGLARVHTLAQEICGQLDAVALQMDSLCLQTCWFCPDICCLKARIWADFKDLIFWHLSGQAVPLHQTLSDLNQVCRYLGSRGCTLPRLSRPFVCTWYVCPTQVSRLQADPEGDRWIGLRDTLQAVKHSRQMLENTFVEALSGNSVFPP